jgi:hypothetical protein
MTALALALASCQTIRSDVTVFNTIDQATPTGFTITAMGAEAGSLEAKSYADLVSAQLVAHGWHPSPGGPVDVAFGYNIDSGQTQTSSMPIFGQTGGGTSYSQGSVYGGGGFGTYSGTTYTPPTFGVVAEVPVSQTFYNRGLRVEMTDRRTHARIYEATLASKGTTGAFNVVAPCLIEALFKNFPGQSGKTYQIEVDSDKCAKQ